MASKNLGLLRSVALVLVVVGLAVVTVGPVAWRPDPIDDAWADRVLGGLIAGIVVALACPRRRGVAAAGLAVLFAGLELLQGIIPGRHPEVLDALVKIAASVNGIALVMSVDWSRQRLDGEWYLFVSVVSTCAILAALAWWRLTPAVAVRNALETAATAACHERGVLPTIDIWDRHRNTFAATVRAGHATICVLVFNRNGATWRLGRVDVRVVSVPISLRRLPHSGTDS